MALHLPDSIEAFSQPHFLIPYSVTHLQEDMSQTKIALGEGTWLFWDRKFLNEECLLDLEHPFWSSHWEQGTRWVQNLALKQPVGPALI